ncbi:MAG TPA: hypothetical protein VMV20_03855 [Chitinophagaceae bacterium]|nr:hypothetical protein [Chitinophagaceae bacterium]
MKKLVYILISILAVLVTALPSFAQQDQVAAQSQDQSNLDKVRAAEVTYLSEKMNLTPAEAEKFWPVYNQYTTEMQQLINERKLALRAQGTATDAQADQALKDEFTFRQKALNIQEKYKSQFLHVLPPRKVAMFYKSREEFRAKVVDELSRRRAMGNPNPPRENQLVRPRPIHMHGR